jgi:tRNA (cmo5U34)-methyltransferase
MTSPKPPSVAEFFNSLTAQYAAAIERCFPRYREMLWALLEYLPADLKVDRIMELGCGTGNLSVLIAERFPEATIDLIDLSAESLQVCQRRMQDAARYQFRTSDFRSLDDQQGSFDLILSSIAIHHLTSIEKQKLFATLFRMLRPGGVFAYADQHAGATPSIIKRHHQYWHEISRAAGSTEDEWELWMAHQRDHDHHDTVIDQIDWLRNTGFQRVDCTWRYLLWTVLQAEKPAR